MKLTNKNPIPENKRIKISFIDESGEFFGIAKNGKFAMDNGGIINGYWQNRVDEWDYAVNLVK